MTSDPRPLAELSREELEAFATEQRTAYDNLVAKGLKLDLTRGKPSADQLNLSDGLLHLPKTTTAPDGTDTRNYGGLAGGIEIREIYAELLGLDTDQLIAGGNSSLTMMRDTLMYLWLHGGVDSERPWGQEETVKFVCPVPGYDRHFTLDDGVWKRVVGYRRVGKEIVHMDYAAGAGATIRFGDGEFGVVPEEGTVFRVSYRLGGGKRSNVPAESIVKFASTLGFVSAVTNPFPVTSGLDPETAEEVRRFAPEAFRAVTYRAVRPEDYARAAERLAWVQRAGAAFRWTGSWLSAFVTPDPRGAVSMTAAWRAELRDQLDRVRQAGREAHGCDPHYADLDLEITICVQPYAYRGETEEAVLEALLGKKGVRARPGFFAADNFTFGTPLDRSALEAAIQAVPGVRAVEDMRIRRRGRFDWRAFTELALEVGMDEVIRLESDPLHPERGSLKLAMEGGA